MDWGRSLGVGLAAVVMAGACSDNNVTDGPEAERVRVEPEAVDEGFYDVPVPLPAGEHGDLVRYQVVGGAPEGLTWYRVMYLSETVRGEPTVVTGVVTVPNGDPPDGGWPLVSHAHGSTGLDDPCSPSVSLDGDRAYAAEILVLSTHAAQRGLVVASTDYEGLGGPGPHPFLVGESEGRSVLDIAVAARQIPGVEVGDRTAIAGYSQGGHAALFANQIAEEWAPSLDIIGTLAGAPPSELGTLNEGLPPDVRPQIDVAMVAGLAAVDDTAVPGEILTPAGLDLLDRLGKECPPIAGIDPATPLLQDEVTDVEPWATLLDRNIPGQRNGRSPVLIVHSAEDANVPIAGSAMLMLRQCSTGLTVERRVVPTGDHLATAVPAYEQGARLVRRPVAGRQAGEHLPWRPLTRDQMRESTAWPKPAVHPPSPTSPSASPPWNAANHRPPRRHLAVAVA